MKSSSSSDTTSSAPTVNAQIMDPVISLSHQPQPGSHPKCEPFPLGDVARGQAATSAQQTKPEPGAPLQVTANRWDGKTQAEGVSLVERNAKPLLNKVTMENFDSVSDQNHLVDEQVREREEWKHGHPSHKTRVRSGYG
jgi:hypothetical protein